MARILAYCALLSMLTLLPGVRPAQAAVINVQIDTAEPQAVLAIMAKLRQNQSVTAHDWDAVFLTRGYALLKKSEAEFHHPFSDDTFKLFVSDPKLLAQFQSLSDTLTTWLSSDMIELTQRAFVYLPNGAKLHATVYPLIEPVSKSFAYQLDTDPVIMLHLDPTVTKDLFEYTVSHELYHVGDVQNCPPASAVAEETTLSQSQKDVLNWIDRFSEGSAVLAAAGGAEVHPHWAGTPSDRAIWDTSMRNFDSDFASMQTFFSNIAAGTLRGDAIEAKASTFFGDVAGPWYTVGYTMDVVIEHAFGRAKLIEATCDRRSYFATYNAAAVKSNEAGNPPLPLWSPQLISLFGK